MTILAFDTAGPYCAAALLREGDAVVLVEDMARGQAERLMGLLDDVLAKAGVSYQDLDAIGVGTGPGNFTGIRISVSAARGLALGLGKPAIGVSLFETTARLSQHTRTAVPAPRDQIYLFDPATMAAPIQTMAEDADADVVLSTRFDAAAHVEATARIAQDRLIAGDPLPRPAPLYVRAADAAPPREAPPVILP